ncbi:MAG: glycosyltransferase [Verrucomicrobiota bacterium]
MTRIGLVTPVWNDSTRLEAFGFPLAEALKNSGLSIKWLVSDDGSPEKEKARLKVLVARLAKVHPEIDLVLCNTRSRKGGAVYQGWDACEDADYLAFVDADGAIDADSTINLIEKALSLGTEAAVIGIRQGDTNEEVTRSLSRALSFRVFRWAVNSLLQVDFTDSQCGIKVIPGSTYRELRSRLSETGLAFDVELLLALRGHGVNLHEFPIRWKEISGGKVNPFRDAWSMLAALLRVRRRLKDNYYERIA